MSALDHPAPESYAPVVSQPNTAADGPSPSQTETPVRRRRPPSASEQMRRVAWGHKWGPLVGASIRAAMKANGAEAA